MKKRNIKYLFLTVLCFVTILITNSKAVLGYNIEYNGKVRDNGSIAIDLVVKSNRDFNNGIAAHNTWIPVNDMPGWSVGTYGSAQMGFSKQPLGTYSTNPADTGKEFSYPNYYAMGMAKSDTPISTEITQDTSAIRKLFSLSNALMVYQVNKRENAKYDLLYNLVAPKDKDTGIALTQDYYYRVKEDDIRYNGDMSETPYNIVFSRFELPPSVVDSVSKLARKNDNMVYFSSLLGTKAPGTESNTINQTAFDMLKMIREHGGYNAYNWGCMLTEDGVNGISALGSVINYYDNILRLTNLAKNQVRVDYVYRAEDGSQIRKTEQEWKDVNDKIIVSQKGIEVPKIGKNEYIGYKVVSSKTKEGAKDLLNTESSADGKGWNHTQVTVKPSDEDQYTIVTFYYDYRQLDISYTVGKQNILPTKSIQTTLRHDKNAEHENLPFFSFGNFSYDLNTKNPYYILTGGSKYNLKSKTFAYNKNWKTPVDLSIGETWNKYFTLKQNPFTVAMKEIDGKDKLKFGDYGLLQLNLEYEAPRNVYVRHFVYDEKASGTSKCVAMSQLANDDEAVWDSFSNQWKIAPNGYNQRKAASGDSVITDAVAPGFHESFTLDKKDKMKIEKSRTLMKEGAIYGYKGYKVAENSASNILDVSSAKALNGANTQVLNVGQGSKDIYIDFYYETKDHTIKNDCEGNECSSDKNPGTPTLEFDPQDSVTGESISTNTGNNQNCKTVYVPAGEKLKPYMSAISSRAYTVIYKATQINPLTGQLQYHLKDYYAYQFNGGAVKNDTNTVGDKATNPINSKINSTGKEGVFHQNSDVGFSVTASNFISEMKATRDKLNSVGSPSNANILEDGRLTQKSDFPDAAKDITKDKYNGLRVPAGTANYNIMALVKNGADIENPTKASEITVTSNSKTTVNVFTPLNIAKVDIKSTDLVDHSQLNTNEVFVIQKNAEFKVTTAFGNADSSIYKNLDTTRYATHVWIKLDFDIKLITNTTVYQDGKVSMKTAGQIVKASDNAFVLVENKNGNYEYSAIATSGNSEGDMISSLRNNIKVVGVTYSIPNDNNREIEYAMLNQAKYIDKGIIKAVPFTCGANQVFDANKITHKDLSVGSDVFKNMYYASHYMAETNKKSTNLSRIYDFKVTDCLDVNFKNVFRETSGDGTVNSLTGVKYFSGLKRLQIYSGNINLMTNVVDDHLNDVPSKTILPLGPQKHTAKNYLQAPKMGYRISFDLKTSGVYQKGNSDNITRYIKITPSYYYIPKNKSITKTNEINDDIVLYYKNASGKYVNFLGSDYTIYFKPNDGYRNTYNKDVTGSNMMSNKLEPLKIGGSSFKLTDNMMETSDNSFIQSWYGEFKLPNSTIAVPKGGNPNQPLTNGYVGVKFKIECVTMEKNSSETATDGSCVIISYEANNKNAQGGVDNTSQWDYESYLGFNNPGKTTINTLRLPLENGDMTIQENDLYNKVKSTVVLFDLDNRAANDFE